MTRGAFSSSNFGFLLLSVEKKGCGFAAFEFQHLLGRFRICAYMRVQSEKRGGWHFTQGGDRWCRFNEEGGVNCHFPAGERVPGRVKMLVYQKQTGLGGRFRQRDEVILGGGSVSKATVDRGTNSPAWTLSITQ